MAAPLLPPTDPATGLVLLARLGVLVALAALALLVARGWALRFLDRVARRTRTFWDEVLVERHVFHRLSWLAPLLVLQAGLPLVIGLPAAQLALLQRLLAAAVVLVVARALSAALAAGGDIYERYPDAKTRPIKGYLQGVTLLVYLAAAVVALGFLLDRSPWLLLSGVGAMTAVLLLVFRDTLLSLVAGVQLTANDLIRVGDWIEMPQFDADGDVIDVALNNVRVQNWDKTFTVIPTHKFLDHSFRNWRGMADAGGRRIKRSLLVDMATVRFLEEADLARLRQFRLLEDYLAAKEAELADHNRALGLEPCEVTNERRLTNLGTFRAYLLAYLRAHPGIRQDMTLLVRQLEPTPQGLPLEIYAFSADTAWAAYEAVQADVFDHVLAIVPQFGLRVYQRPAGSDLAELGRAGAVPGLHVAAGEGR